MLKNLVESTFQRATVAQDYDELGINVGRMRVQLNDLRHTLREVMQEMEALRTELAALKANGIAAPTNGHAPAVERPITVPDAVLDAAHGAAAPAAAPSAKATGSSIAAAIARDAKGETPAPVDEHEGPVRIAADGSAYWGPLDNASARAKAAGKKLIIDQPECIACGTCVEQTDLVFVLPDDAKAVPKEQEGPMDAIQDAIDACPVTCIHWTDNPAQFEQLNDVTGHKLA